MYDINSSVLTKTGYSAAQLESAVKAVRPDAGFDNYPAFVDAENATGISSLYLIAHACEESAWGTEQIAPNNIYGFNADDANPAGDASSFSSQAVCIYFVSKFLLANYLTAGGKYYQGTTLHDIFVNYSSSHDQEAAIVASIMNLLASKISASQPAPAPEPESNQYVVKEGDSLSSIASAHNMSLGQLEALNPNAGHPSGDFNVIWPGDSLTVNGAPAPTYYTVVEGDSFYSIAENHGISLQQLESLNPEAGHPAGNFDNIWVDDSIRIN